MLEVVLTRTTVLVFSRGVTRKVTTVQTSKTVSFTRATTVDEEEDPDPTLRSTAKPVLLPVTFAEDTTVGNPAIISRRSLGSSAGK